MLDTAIADAPGRVNLIGEHTDYHQGFVLPTVIPQRTIVRVERRADQRALVASSAMKPSIGEYVVGLETPAGEWLDYVRGVTATLARHGMPSGGFSARIDSTVPVGAGVASSAALEVSLLRTLRSLNALTFDDITLAKLAQAVETDFVGAPVGIMDQMACSVGRDREALFLDTRTLAFEPVPLPASIELVVIDSGITHAHAHGQYVTRRRESFEAAAQLGVAYLRDLDPSALPRVETLPAVLARRARHIVTENQRVLDAVAALRAQDARTLGVLFAGSHASMRDDYEISTPEIDALVAIAASHEDVFGARLTGGGFGGAVVILAAAGAGRSAAEAICDCYRHNTKRPGRILVPAIHDSHETAS